MVPLYIGMTVSALLWLYMCVCVHVHANTPSVFMELYVVLPITS